LPLNKDSLEALKQLKTEFGIKDDFPISQLFSRSEKSPIMYFVSPGVKELFVNDKQDRLLVINMGIKMFIKHHVTDSKCPYRLSQEGMPWLFPYITKRIITITEKDFDILLTTKDPFFSTFTDSVQRGLQALDQGPVVFVLDPKCKRKAAGMALSGWRGKVSCHLLVQKSEISVLSELEMSTAEKDTGKKKEKKQ